MLKKELNYDYWLSLWMHSKKLSVKESTYIRYRNLVHNHISPELGKFSIDKISTQIMEQFVTDKLNKGRLDGNGGLSPKSVSDIMTIVKESFEYADFYGETTTCCFKRISFRKITAKIRILNYEDEKKLLSVLYNNFDRYKLGVFICLYTGIRIGELCALQWKDIFLNESVIKIERTVQRLQSQNPDELRKTHLIVTEPKSYSSIRTIPMPSFVFELVKSFADEPDAYILTGNSNTLIEPRTMQNKFKAYLREANIENINFHALRHTFATRCVEAGFDIKTLSEILGHSSVKITLDKYVHSSMKLKRSNMEKLRPAIE